MSPAAGARGGQQHFHTRHLLRPPRQDLVLSPDQEEGVEIALDRMERFARSGDPAFRHTIMEGPAGAGKTELLRRILWEHGRPDLVTCAAPTGKAALRMQESTGLRGRTIHQVLMGKILRERADGTFVFAGRDIEAVRSDVLGEDDDELAFLRMPPVAAFDETSMMTRPIRHRIEDTLPEAMALFFMGDQHQLKPPMGKPAFNLERQAHIHLTTVHRQALESPILRLATWIREQRQRPNVPRAKRAGVPYRRCPVDVVVRALMKDPDADQMVVCYTHRTRRAINHFVRQHQGLPPRKAGPQVGERVWVRRNCLPLDVYNGTITKVTKVEDLEMDSPWLDPDREPEPYELGGMLDWSAVQLKADSIIQRDHSVKKGALGFWRVWFEDREIPAIVPKWTWRADRKMYFEESELVRAIFEDAEGVTGTDPSWSVLSRRVLDISPGWAITCHAAQGSQWDKLIVVDERMGDYTWWYTALTRAVSKGFIVDLSVDLSRIFRKQEERKRRSFRNKTTVITQ